jgi:hypothetical protein
LSKFFSLSGFKAAKSTELKSNLSSFLIATFGEPFSLVAFFGFSFKLARCIA